MKRISIGITGVNPFDGNRGVGALSYSIISILDDIAAQEKNEHTYYFILNGSGLPEYTELDINGTKRTTFLKSAKNKEIFALPKAKKVC